MKVFLGVFIIFQTFSSLKSSSLRVNDVLESRVNGGTAADPNIAKYFVSLIVEFETITRTCGGYVYLGNAVSTTASCVME
jgi:secreted trypsin-like serine protease